jgi:hypothetical protein
MKTRGYHRLEAAFAVLFLATLTGDAARAQSYSAQATPQSVPGYGDPRWATNAYPGTQGTGQVPGAGTLPKASQRPAGPDVGAPPAAPGMIGAGTGTGAGGGSPVTSPTDLAAGAGAGADSSALGGGLSGGGGNLTMLGDQGPFSRLSAFQARQPGLPPPIKPPVPGQPGQGLLRGAVLIPSIRNFKVSDNQSPRPQDRIYFGFNFFDDVNAAINQRFGAPVTGMRIYRETFGFEKTFLDQTASIGLRLPYDQLTANSSIRGLGGTNSALGDLAIILKYAFWQNCDTGSLVSGGLLVSAPTGPHAFAGANNITSLHNATLQPWMGYIYNVTPDLYFHGFSSIDVPTGPTDVTMWYNDIGVGYYLYRAEKPKERFLTAVIPTFEVHVNTPLNHRDVFNLGDAAGTPDVVDLTIGSTFVARERCLLSAAYVNPVTGPRPFSGEFLLQLNIRF